MAEAITVGIFTQAIKRVAAGMQTAATELNAADGALGDGDLGITVSRGFAEAAAETFPAEFGGVFLACSKAIQRVSSSSYGTLLATAFLSAAKSCKGKETIAPAEIPAIVEAALAAMMARGKGALGDKTVLDVLQAVTDALKAAGPVEAYAASLAAARATLEEFKGKPNKLGRARMFGEGSVGLYDPGQLAMVRIIEALGPKP
jgi:dihydroxyacetone kinase-like protein